MTWISNAWNNITPWNTQDERNQNSENKIKELEKETQLAIEKQKAGIVDENTLKMFQEKMSNNMYLIIAVALVLIVGLVVYFKFRKK